MAFLFYVIVSLVCWLCICLISMHMCEQDLAVCSVKCDNVALFSCFASFSCFAARLAADVLLLLVSFGKC